MNTFSWARIVHVQVAEAWLESGLHLMSRNAYIMEIQMRSEEQGRASWNVVKRDVIREPFIWWKLDFQ